MSDAAVAIWCNLPHLMQSATHQAPAAHIASKSSALPQPLAHQSPPTHLYEHSTHTRA
jgi:hypothetical protein